MDILKTILSLAVAGLAVIMYPVTSESDVDDEIKIKGMTRQDGAKVLYLSCLYFTQGKDENETCTEYSETFLGIANTEMALDIVFKSLKSDLNGSIIEDVINDIQESFDEEYYSRMSPKIRYKLMNKFYFSDATSYGSLVAADFENFTVLNADGCNPSYRLYCDENYVCKNCTGQVGEGKVCDFWSHFDVIWDWVTENKTVSVTQEANNITATTQRGIYRQGTETIREANAVTEAEGAAGWTLKRSSDRCAVAAIGIFCHFMISF